MGIPLEGTRVPFTSSVRQIEAMLERLGVRAFSYATIKNDDRDVERVTISFHIEDLNVSLEIELEKIIKRIWKPSSDERTIRDRALRMAGRQLYYQIETVFRSVQMGLLDLHEAFLFGVMVQTPRGPMPMRHIFTKQLLTEGQSKQLRLPEGGE